LRRPRLGAQRRTAPLPIDRHGARLLVPDITIEGWWTSLGECVCGDAKVIALYCDHATSEQFHSEFKTDLDIERLPSGKFATNGRPLDYISPLVWLARPMLSRLYPRACAGSIMH
jgi:hypothetical protein